MNWLSKITAFVVVIFLMIPQSITSKTPEGLVYSEQVFDFGYVGIGFKLFHTFHLINYEPKPVKIKNLSISCDCSTVRMSDSTINPGDTVFFEMSFLTSNLYGPTTKSFLVSFDDPDRPQLTFFYKAMIGQWIRGLKPNPISLFFLPGHKTKKVTITNLLFDVASLSVTDQPHTTFSIKLIESEAVRGEALALEVIPNTNLQKGSYLSSFTLEIQRGNNNKPVVLTIPVKIAKY